MFQFVIYPYYLMGKHINDGILFIKTGAPITISQIGTISQVVEVLKHFGDNRNDDKFPERLLSSRTAAIELSETLNNIIRRVSEWGLPSNASVSRIESDAVQSGLANFESILMRDLGALPVFCVNDKGNLSAPNLILSASSGYPPKVTATGRLCETRDRCIRPVPSLQQSYGVRIPHFPGC